MTATRSFKITSYISIQCVKNKKGIKSTHTNCFFLSVDKRVISSLSAFISTSLYWKSRTRNLDPEINTHAEANTHAPLGSTRWNKRRKRARKMKSHWRGNCRGCQGPVKSRLSWDRFLELSKWVALSWKLQQASMRQSLCVTANYGRKSF